MRRTNRRLQNAAKSSQIKLHQEISLFELSAIDGRMEDVCCLYKITTCSTLPGTNVGLRGESEKRCKPGPKCGRCKPGGGSEMPPMEMEGMLLF